MIGSDTSFIIDFLKGEVAAIAAMEKYREQIYLCEPVVFEFLCGNLTAAETEKFHTFVSKFTVFNFDRNSSVTAAALLRTCKRLGKSISNPDAMIAGTYRANHINAIITRNKNHFQHISQIKVITY